MKPPEKKWPHAKVAGQQPERPTAHARQFKPPVAQAKSAAPASAGRHPAAPPTYRPQPKTTVAQQKAAGPSQVRTPPVAPPVYRPQPAPSMQTKESRPKGVVRLPAPPPAHPPAPPVYRPQSAPKVLQRKTGNPSGASGPQAAAPPPARRRVVPAGPQSRAKGDTIQRSASSAYSPDDDWEATAGKFLMQMDEEAAAIRKAAAAKDDKKDEKAPAVAPPSDPATGGDIVRLAKAGLLTVGAPKNMNTLSFDPDEPRDSTTGKFNSYNQNYSYPLSYAGKVIAYLHTHYNTNDPTKVSTVKATSKVKDPLSEIAKVRGGYILDFAPKSIEDAAKVLQHK